LTFKSPAEYCSHYPLIDIREAEGGAIYGRYSESLQDWESIRKINTEKLYYGLLYISNGAANNLSPQTDIHNARIRLIITPQQSNRYIVEAILLADNTDSISGHLILQTETDKRIEVGDVIEIFNYQGKFPPIKIFNKSDVIQSKENKTVLEIPIGDLKPGFETDLFIRFNFLAK
jgi:hypothetical protein